MHMNPSIKNKLVPLAVLIAVLATVGFTWTQMRPKGPGSAFISGNGRIEATEIDVAAKLGGRITEIFVNEGDFVHSGDVLAVAVCPTDRNLFASASIDLTTRIWDIRGGRAVQTFDGGHTSDVNDVAFLPSSGFVFGDGLVLAVLAAATSSAFSCMRRSLLSPASRAVPAAAACVSGS